MSQLKWSKTLLRPSNFISQKILLQMSFGFSFASFPVYFCLCTVCAGVLDCLVVLWSSVIFTSLNANAVGQAPTFMIHSIPAITLSVIQKHLSIPKSEVSETPHCDTQTPLKLFVGSRRKPPSLCSTVKVKEQTISKQELTQWFRFTGEWFVILLFYDTSDCSGHWRDDRLTAGRTIGGTLMTLKRQRSHYRCHKHSCFMQIKDIKGSTMSVFLFDRRQATKFWFSICRPDLFRKVSLVRISRNATNANKARNESVSCSGEMMWL